MELRHNNELETKKHELEVQLPMKVKESSECLNLRKMEEHMAKQRKYISLYLAMSKPIKFNRKLLNLRFRKSTNGCRAETTSVAQP